MNEEFDEARRQVRIKAEVARRMRLRRKTARRAKVGEMRDRGSELFTKLRKGKIGRAALKALNA